MPNLDFTQTKQNQIKKQLEPQTELYNNFWKEKFGDEWLKGYENSWDRADRHELIALFKSLDKEAPLKSFLEVGCNCAPILNLLLGQFPEAEYNGIDINWKAVNRARFNWRAFSRSLHFYIGDMFEELAKFPSNSVDVVFTISVLTSVREEDIPTVLAEMIRITKRVVVLQEPIINRPEDDYYQKNHDYAAILSRVNLDGKRVIRLECA